MFNRPLFLLTLCLVLSVSSLFSQSCDNSDFETGTLNSWDAFTGTCCGGGITNPGVVNERHTVVGDLGNDPLSLDTISFLAPSGGDFSVRLGNSNVGSEAEKLTKSFLVTSENTAFTYQYALLLEDPSGHSQNNKPKFEVRLLDQNLDVIPGPCGYYQVTAGPATNTWFKNGSIRFKDWATVGIDLTPYIGQVMTIEFSVEDCGLGGHFGYAYIDAKCGFLDVVVNGFCKGDNDSVFVTAPEGFDAYYWPLSGETTRTIMLEYPEVGDSVIVEITNEAGCASQILHIFEEKEDPNGGITKGGDVCAGEDIFLRPDTLESEWRYVWTSDEEGFLVEDTVLPLNLIETSTYYLEILNENGCGNEFARDTVTVNVDTALVFYASDIGPVCPGDNNKIELDSLKGMYTWLVGSETGLDKNESVDLSPSTTTSYTIKAENQTCEWEQEFKINVVGGASLPDTIDLAFCPGDASLTIEANYAGFIDFEFDGVGSAANSVQINNPTDNQMVELILTSTVGCKDTIIYNIHESYYPTVNLSLQDDSICLGLAAKVTAQNGASGDSYVWGNDMGVNIYSSSSVQYISTTKSGRVWIEVTNADGCSNTASVDTIDLFVNDSAIFTMASDTTICLGDSARLFPIGGTGTYQWTSSLNTISSTDSAVIVKPIQNEVFYLQMTNGDCSYSGYRKVNVSQPLTIAPQEIEYCEDQVSVSINGPSGYVDYKWIGEASTSQVGTATGISDGKLVDLALVNIYGCKDTTSYTLKEISFPTFSVSDDVIICSGESAKLSITSNYNLNSYNWTSIPAGTSTSNPSPTVSPTLTTKYIATYSNAINCVAPNPFDTVEVTVDGSTINELGSNKEICVGESVQLVSSSGIGDFSWTSSPGSFSSSDSSVTVSPVISTNYTQQVSNTNCTSTDNIWVVVQSLPDPFVNNATAIACSDASAILEMDNFVSGSYLWTTPDGFTSSSSQLSIGPDEGGIYYLEITDNNNCYSIDSIEVLVDELPTIQGGSPDICGNHPLTLLGHSNPSYSFNWSTGEIAQSIDVITPGTYDVVITNGACDIVETFVVGQIFSPGEGDIPTVFTPNEDGLNDEFILPFTNAINYKLVIYNRWGLKMFETTNPNEYWDGINGFFRVSNGVYFYAISYESPCFKGVKQVNGFVEVVKD